jgi:hypothetical protein
MQPLKPTIGQPATGREHYFDRPQISQQIRRGLERGGNLLISAPRRIGKSSLIKHLLTQAAANEIIIYISVQSATHSNEFFEKLFKELIKNNTVFAGMNGFTQRASAGLKNIISRVRNITLEGGLEIDKTANIDYYTELQTLIKALTEKKVILLLDEFPDAVSNMIRRNKQLAIEFLLQMRELRQISSDLGLQFILTGSSGLANVVSQLGENDLINDLEEISVPPYTEQEASVFIQRLVLGYQIHYSSDFQINDNTLAYILEKINWRLPYYLQIMIKSLFEAFENKQIIAEPATVDKVLAAMLTAQSEYYGYFQYWYQRLQDNLDNASYQAAIEMLNQLACDKVSSLAQLKSLPFATKPKLPVKQILNILEHDGYISQHQQQYGFNSFLLKQWWVEHVAD